MAGENCTLTAAGYGSTTVLLERFSHGVEIIGSEDAGRLHKAFYVKAVTASHFSITIMLGSNKTRAFLFLIWLKRYADQLASASSGVGPMRVQVPSRGFDRLAILKTGIRVSETLDEVNKKLTLGFIGARTPDDFANPMASQFVNTSDVDARYFYPGGQQLTASDDPDDALYGGVNPRSWGWGWGGNWGRENRSPLPDIQTEE